MSSNLETLRKRQGVELALITKLSLLLKLEVKYSFCQKLRDNFSNSSSQKRSACPSEFGKPQNLEKFIVVEAKVMFDENSTLENDYSYSD